MVCNKSRRYITNEYNTYYEDVYDLFELLKEESKTKSKKRIIERNFGANGLVKKRTIFD